MVTAIRLYTLLICQERQRLLQADFLDCTAHSHIYFFYPRMSPLGNKIKCFVINWEKKIIRSSVLLVS